LAHCLPEILSMDSLKRENNKENGKYSAPDRKSMQGTHEDCEIR